MKDALTLALNEEGITGDVADIARSIYAQESSSGKNTKTSNAGARGGMQIIPATFNRVADKGWNIDDPVHNARAGVRYINTLYSKAGGDPALTAAGYYGGEGAINKARKGIAVSDPRNPNAPNTLQYGKQVAARMKPTFTDDENAKFEAMYAAEQNDFSDEENAKFEAMYAQENAPQQQQKSPTKSKASDTGFAQGLISGAAGIGKNLLSASSFIPRQIEKGANAIGGTGTPLNDYIANMRQGNADFVKSQEGKSGFGAGRLMSEIAGTAGAGNVLSIGAKIANMPRLAASLSSGGMSLGADNVGMLSKQGANNLGIRALGGGATGVTAGGLIDPETAGLTGGISAAIPVLGKTAGAVGKTIAGKPINDLAQTAISKYGIPLDRASTSNSKILKATKTVLDDILPFGVGAKQKEAIKSTFNREVGKVAGIDAEPVTGGSLKLTADAVSKAKQKISQSYDKVWNQNKFVVDRTFANNATDLIQDASTKLNPEQANMLNRHFDNLIAQSKDGKVDGAFVNNWQSELRQMAESETGLHKKFINDLRQTTLSSFKRNISKDDAKLLVDTNIKNRAFKTLEPLLNKGEAGVAGREAGDVPPALLSSAVAGNYGNVASSPFGDLPKIGSNYLVDRVSRAGGSERGLVQNAATAMLGAGAYGVGTGAIWLS